LITVEIEGINSLECEEKVKELILNINDVINIKINRNKNKMKIKVKDSKKMDLSTISNAISNAGCKCTLVKNY
jgi:copper chaperone CopZ